jgi:hypothetical protein
MPPNQFPLDPVQTQLTRTTTNVVAPSVAGPQQTGLSQSLAELGKSFGSFAKLMKDRREKDEMKTAALAGAIGEVAPKLWFQSSIDHNHKVIEGNYTNDVIDQLKNFGETHVPNLTNDGSKDLIQKSDEIETYLDVVMAHARQVITHDGESLSKLILSIDSYKRSWLQDAVQFQKQVTTQANIKNLVTNMKHAIDIIPPQDPVENIVTNENFKKQTTDLITAGTQKEYYKLPDGTIIRATEGLDAQKAVFQLWTDVVYDRYEKNPFRFGSLITEFQGFIGKVIDPLIIVENTRLVSGKADAIGDDTTFQAIKENFNTKKSEFDKALEKLSKTGWTSWRNKLIERIRSKVKGPRDRTREGIIQQTKLTESEKEEVQSQFPDDFEGRAKGNRAIKEIEDSLLLYKNSKDSQAYRNLRRRIYRREITLDEVIRDQVHRRGIDPDLIPELVKLTAQIGETVSKNIARMEKRVPALAFSRIKKALDSTILLEHIERGLDAYGLKKQLVMDIHTLGKLVDRISRTQLAEEHREPILEAQRIYNKIATMTEDRAFEIIERKYKPRKKEIVDGKTMFKIDETKDINTNSEINGDQLDAYTEEATSMYNALIDMFADVRKKERKTTK